MPAEKMADIFKDIQEEYVEQANDGKKTFLFVYAMGHSKRDRESLKFVLNSTPHNLQIKPLIIILLSM